LPGYARKRERVYGAVALLWFTATIVVVLIALL